MQPAGGQASRASAAKEKLTSPERNEAPSSPSHFLKIPKTLASPETGAPPREQPAPPSPARPRMQRALRATLPETDAPPLPTPVPSRGVQCSQCSLLLRVVYGHSAF